MTEEISPPLKEYSSYEMSKTLERLRDPIEFILDLAYKDLVLYSENDQRNISVSDFFQEVLSEFPESTDDKPSPLNSLHPSNEDRRVMFAYYGITDDMLAQSSR